MPETKKQKVVLVAFYSAQIQDKTDLTYFDRALASIVSSDKAHMGLCWGEIDSVNQKKKLSFQPVELSAWNGRESGFCSLMSTQHRDFQSNPVIDVRMSHLFYVPIHDRAYDALQHALGTNHKEIPLDEKQKYRKIFEKKNMGLPYPTLPCIVRDFFLSMFNFSDPAGTEEIEKIMNDAEFNFERDGVQCAQISVWWLLLLLKTNSFAHSVTCNSIVYELKKCLQQRTSLQPSLVYDILTRFKLDDVEKENFFVPVTPCKDFAVSLNGIIVHALHEICIPNPGKNHH